MKITKPVRRLTMGFAAAALVSTMVVGSSVNAFAAPAPQTVELCASPNYAAYIQFDDRGGWKTWTVRGTCLKGNFYNGGGYERIKFRGVWNTNPGSFYICTVFVNLATTGVKVTVGGTTTNPTWTGCYR